MNTKNQIILLVDMDGVLADYYGHFCTVFKALHPEVEIIPESHLSNFYIEDAYPPQYKDEIRRITCEKGFFEGIPPVEGAIEAFKGLLADERFNVRICTAPELEYTNQDCFSEKARWIEKYLGPEALKRTIITKDKTLIMGDYLIDDKPEITGSTDPLWCHIVFHQRYNDHLDEIRLLSWKHWQHLARDIIQIEGDCRDVEFENVLEIKA